MLHFLLSVIPAKAGIHRRAAWRGRMDPGFRRDDSARKRDIFFEMLRAAGAGCVFPRGEGALRLGSTTSRQPRNEALVRRLVHQRGELAGIAELELEEPAVAHGIG